MQTAALTGFIRTLLWILIGWFIIKTISRYFKFNTLDNSVPKHPEPGEVRIDQRTPPSSGKVDNDAEFVDFEEIDDSDS